MAMGSELKEGKTRGVSFPKLCFIADGLDWIEGVRVAFVRIILLGVSKILLPVSINNPTG